MVKVRRPGVEGVVETDINVLMGIAQLMERHMHGSDIYDPVGLVEGVRPHHPPRDGFFPGRTHH